MRFLFSTWGLLLAAALCPAQPTPWGFARPVRPALPPVADPQWVRTPVDAFILARLEKAGLRPAGPASPATLLRRVTLDLTGLPPTPAELDQFLHDGRPDAYERVVERLLASPHHGERWAQHWLDVVRYAESNGYEADGERPQAWRYRDWVVRSLNEDRPYDRFLTEQLAGDLLAAQAARRRGADKPGRPEAGLLVAAGFNRCGPVHQTVGNVDPIVLRNELLTEMTGAVGFAFLGLTVGCARCHDHKFDPISQKDYYALEAFFSTAQPTEVDLATPAERADHDRSLREVEAQLAPLRKELADLEGPYRERLTEAKKQKLDEPTRLALETAPGRRTPEQQRLAELAEPLIKLEWNELVDALSLADRERRGSLRRRLHQLEVRKPPSLTRAWTIAENGTERSAHILKRGNPHQKGRRVVPAFPRAFRLEESTPAPADRLALARWLTRPDHPLTARVIANRLWQQHFGQGLVRTPNDFGVRGPPPTHPELLDWLATELTTHGWSLKHLHRLMVLSSTYRQASSSECTRPNESRPDRSGQEPPASSSALPRSVDPDNHLLWRMNRHRLTGEALRDAILAVTGALNPRLEGPMVRVPLEPEVYDLIFTESEPDDLWPVTPDPREHGRRSLYLFRKRNVRLPLLEAFDQPDALTSCPVRPVSTFAPQALILWNGPFLHEQARVFAARLLREAGSDPARVKRAYLLALARPPRPDELRTALRFLDGQADLLRSRLQAHLPVGLPPGAPGEIDPARAAALADFCLALLNSNSFLYIK